MKSDHTRNRLFIRRGKGDTMQVVFTEKVQMQTGNKNRKEWFLISKSDSLNIPLQHIQHYRKHMMSGLQGMWPAIWKTEKPEETCTLHWKVKDISSYFMKEGKVASATHLSWGFLVVFIGWVVWEGVCVCWGCFPKTTMNFPIILFTSPNTNSEVHPAVLLTLNTNIFEKTESISITLFMAF